LYGALYVYIVVCALAAQPAADDLSGTVDCIRCCLFCGCFVGVKDNSSASRDRRWNHSCVFGSVVRASTIEPFITSVCAPMLPCSLPPPRQICTHVRPSVASSRRERRALDRPRRARHGRDRQLTVAVIIWRRPHWWCCCHRRAWASDCVNTAVRTCSARACPTLRWLMFCASKSTRTLLSALWPPPPWLPHVPASCACVCAHMRTLAHRCPLPDGCIPALPV
jgi:hypothetical protein